MCKNFWTFGWISKRTIEQKISTKFFNQIWIFHRYLAAFGLWNQKKMVTNMWFWKLRKENNLVIPKNLLIRRPTTNSTRTKSWMKRCFEQSCPAGLLTFQKPCMIIRLTLYWWEFNILSIFFLSWNSIQKTQRKADEYQVIILKRTQRAVLKTKITTHFYCCSSILERYLIVILSSINGTWDFLVILRKIMSLRKEIPLFSWSLLLRGRSWRAALSNTSVILQVWFIIRRAYKNPGKLNFTTINKYQISHYDGHLLY